jgi:hypothetical protein
MSLKCKIGFHSWKGCKCTDCGKIRDENHNWSKDCEQCSKCGKTRDNHHDWTIDDCTKCSKCEKSRKHDWNQNIERCSRCAKTYKDYILESLTGSKYYDVDFILSKITDQAILAKVVCEAKEWTHRWNALKLVDNQEVLAKAAVSDVYYEVRKTAVSKLTDSILLEKISRLDKDKNVREGAIYRLKDIRIDEINNLMDQTELARIATEDLSLTYRLSAVKKLTDRLLLDRFAREETDWRMRLAAVEQINEPSLLAKFAMEDPNSSVRKFLIMNPNLSLHSISEIARNETEEDVCKEIIKKIFDENTLRDLSQNAKSIHMRTLAAEKMAMATRSYNYVLKVTQVHGENIGNWLKQLFDLYDKSPSGEGYSVGDEGRILVSKIGEEINTEGGVKLMLEIHKLFAGHHYQQARNLELSWNGIGGWQG